MALKAFTPITARGEEGLRHIVDEAFDVQEWAIENAQELVDSGYTKLDVRPYTPTRIVGDKMAWRRS